MSNYRNICYAELMDIDWHNGWVTILALKTDLGFLTVILCVILAGILLGRLLYQTYKAYKKTKEFPTSTLFPLLMVFATYFLFMEAIQYYYLRPIAFYFLFLHLGAALFTCMFWNRNKTKTAPKKKVSKK